MGLDISALSHIKYVSSEYVEDSCEVREITQGSEWAKLLRDRCRYQAGFYVGEQSHAFHAGSYSGYNWWRSSLEDIAANIKRSNDYPLESPFQELIEFSDCEGVIDDVNSAKLAADFARFERVSQSHANQMVAAMAGERFMAKYRDWKQAFEIAQHGGAVFFH